MVSPFPYPSALYIAGEKSGKPKPAKERRHETAARARNVGMSHAQESAQSAQRTGCRIQRKGVNDVRLDCLEIDDHPCSDESHALRVKIKLRCDVLRLNAGEHTILLEIFAYILWHGERARAIGGEVYVHRSHRREVYT